MVRLAKATEIAHFAQGLAPFRPHSLRGNLISPQPITTPFALMPMSRLIPVMRQVTSHLPAPQMKQSLSRFRRSTRGFFTALTVGSRYNSLRTIVDSSGGRATVTARVPRESRVMAPDVELMLLAVSLSWRFLTALISVCRGGSPGHSVEATFHNSGNLFLAGGPFHST